MGCAPREGGVLMVHAARSSRGLLLAVAMALPLSASAQDGYVEETEAVPGVERWHPNAYADPASAPESELQLEYVPADPLKAADEGVRKARRRVGLWSLGVVGGAGVSATGVGIAVSCSFGTCDPGGGIALFSIGIVIGTVSLAAMIASGVKLHKRKDERDALRATPPSQRRRVRWDHSTARWVF